MGIRELQAQKAEALEMYHEECARIDEEIEAIRAKRRGRAGGQDMPGGKTRAEDAHLLNIADGRSLPRRNGNW